MENIDPELLNEVVTVREPDGSTVHKMVKDCTWEQIEALAAEAKAREDALIETRHAMGDLPEPSAN